MIAAQVGKASGNASSPVVLENACEDGLAILVELGV
jgi:hypothetical protein